MAPSSPREGSMPRPRTRALALHDQCRRYKRHRRPVEIKRTSIIVYTPVSTQSKLRVILIRSHYRDPVFLQKILKISYSLRDLKAKSHVEFSNLQLWIVAHQVSVSKNINEC